MTIKTVHIDLAERSYDIHIASGLMSSIKSSLPESVTKGKVFILCDENVKPIAAHIEQQFENALIKILPAGEATKSFAHFEECCRWMLQNNVDRKSSLIAVGGGVIGDLAGYTAASVMRGIHFVQVPTTLLAQVDSSVGGKTGINTQEGKNLVGAFYQPKAVIADLDSLKTLPRRELLAGYAEIVKYGLLGDAPFFEWLEENGSRVLDLEPESLSCAIEKSVQAKADIVAADEREGGKRALLNLGHTFGHALEAAALYDGRLLHGEGVSIGMVMAFDLCTRMGLCTENDLERARAHLLSSALPVDCKNIPDFKPDVEQLLTLMGRDKKASGGKINFILVRGIGEAFVSADVDMDLVSAVLSDYI